jgi:hypothetical protein
MSFIKLGFFHYLFSNKINFILKITFTFLPEVNIYVPLNEILFIVFGLFAFSCHHIFFVFPSNLYEPIRILNFILQLAPFLIYLDLFL